MFPKSECYRTDFKQLHRKLQVARPVATEINIRWLDVRCLMIIQRVNTLIVRDLGCIKKIANYIFVFVRAVNLEKKPVTK